MTMGSDVVEQTRALLQRLASEGVLARVLGGVGVALRCPSASRPPLARDYHDVDLMTDRRNAHALSERLTSEGYLANERFNALHGHSRMIFTAPDMTHMDVLVDEFVMCHKLDLRGRLKLHGETLALSDLLLTKLQIAEMNRKDVLDIVAVLVDHPLSDDDRGIDASRVVEVLSNDWGWWRTVTDSLDMVGEHILGLSLGPADAEQAQGRLAALKSAIGSGRRSLRWKARAHIGDRVAWRFDPEEVNV